MLVPMVTWPGTVRAFTSLMVGFVRPGALATFAVLAVVYLVVPNPLGGAALLPGAVALWSVFISIVALPHVVGSLLDRERGIWYVP